MTLTQYCQFIRPKPVDEVATDDVLRVLEPIWNTIPERASRLRGRIETVMDAARARGHTTPTTPIQPDGRATSPSSCRSPRSSAVGTTPPCPTDLPELHGAARRDRHHASRALQFTILTAAEPGSDDASGEIDFDKAIWTIPPTDEDKSALTRARYPPGPRHPAPSAEESESNPHVFPGRPMRPLGAWRWHDAP